MSVTGDAGPTQSRRSRPLRCPAGASPCRRSSASTARLRPPSARRSARRGSRQSYDGAAAASRLTPLRVATLAGDVFRGPHLVSGGGSRRSARHPRDEARNQGAARRGSGAGRDALPASRRRRRSSRPRSPTRSSAIAALNAEHHKQEKAVVGHDAQLQHATDEETRLAQKAEQLARERFQAEEERDDARPPPGGSARRRLRGSTRRSARPTSG